MSDRKYPQQIQLYSNVEKKALPLYGLAVSAGKARSFRQFVNEMVLIGLEATANPPKRSVKP